jgi:FecR-like protein
MQLSRLNWFAGFILAAILCAPAWGATPALPGTLNYVEGQAAVGTEALNAKSVGSVSLQSGQTLTTETGKAEILLTPGVFFRVGDNSSATLVSPSLTNTEISLNKGQALVEVAEIYKDNLLRVQEDGATTQLLKTGLYGFDANNGDVRVFKGEALVQDGDQNIKVKGGHELDVNDTGKLKTHKFNKSAYEESDLYRFSSLRSQYLAEANVDAAGRYIGGGPGWYGTGWYWDPFFMDYTWIPGDGMFYSPFGWGFYSPWFVSYAPFYYGGYYPYGHYWGHARPYYGGHPAYAGRSGYVGRPGYAAPHAGAGFRAAPSMGASHSFGVMGGNFHGGGGFRR